MTIPRTHICPSPSRCRLRRYCAQCSVGLRRRRSRRTSEIFCASIASSVWRMSLQQSSGADNGPLRTKVHTSTVVTHLGRSRGAMAAPMPRRAPRGVLGAQGHARPPRYGRQRHNARTRGNDRVGSVVLAGGYERAGVGVDRRGSGECCAPQRPRHRTGWHSPRVSPIPARGGSGRMPSCSTRPSGPPGHSSRSSNPAST